MKMFSLLILLDWDEFFIVIFPVTFVEFFVFFDALKTAGPYLTVGTLIF